MLGHRQGPTRSKFLATARLFEAMGDLPGPTWPDVSFRDLLAIAFKGKRIDTLDHPVLRRLRGEA